MSPPLISTFGLRALRHVADSAGMLASGLCLLHCLAFPVLIALFPFVAPAGDSEIFHGAMVGLALVAALLALAPGYLTHRRAVIAAMGIAGLACLAGAVFVLGPRYGEAAETMLTVAGAVLLTLAHLRNRACCRACVTPR